MCCYPISSGMESHGAHHKAQGTPPRDTHFHRHTNTHRWSRLWRVQNCNYFPSLFIIIIMKIHHYSLESTLLAPPCLFDVLSWRYGSNMVPAWCPCCCRGLWVINDHANMAEHLLWLAPPVIWVGDLSTNTKREETVGWKLFKVGGWLCWTTNRWKLSQSIRGGQTDES